MCRHDLKKFNPVYKHKGQSPSSILGYTFSPGARGQFHSSTTPQSNTISSTTNDVEPTAPFEYTLNENVSTSIVSRDNGFNSTYGQHSIRPGVVRQLPRTLQSPTSANRSFFLSINQEASDYSKE